MVEAFIAINHPNEDGNFYRACVNNLMLYRGAKMSGFFGLLRLVGVPHVKLASYFTVSNRMCPVLENGGPAECIAFQSVTRKLKASGVSDTLV